ncbi:uncharacterized protein LOC133303798 [Gastrolobium bilobum]|uniref:uncharacterized protein LOC133303798 n=1 Tax=Gastrolobium bilobum TaxID=150636 RepID=UPI002AB2D4A1|nr:uncharacterized protein LOC133303798 [Gastrolobium bilobum]
MDVDEHLNAVGDSGSEAENKRSDSLDNENKSCQAEPEDLQVGIELTETVTMHAENGRSVSGAKRARITVDEHQPSVHFVYSSLTRASRKKLEELLQQWSEWHAKHITSSNDPSEVLESGEETFFPALHVGLEKTSSVSFWMENQTRNDKNKDFIPLDGDSVPLYDRGYALGLTSADGSSNVDGGLEIIDAAARCFNCGSYNHSLRECPKPRNNVAVNNARKQHKSRRNQNASSRNPTRYYQNSPAGKYDGLRPGALDDVTRQLLGMGELDPPPWLNRMREIGYPPGYLDVDDEDQPSGITIYTDREISEQEDGEIMEADFSKPKRKMTVEFPGINAPIPGNADQRLWAAVTGPSSSDVPRNWSQHRWNQSPEYGSRGYYREQRLLGDFREDGPPGDPGYNSSKYSFHPRFGGHDSVPRSPSMSRSQSDRRSPLHDEESPKPISFHSLHYSSSERLLSPLDRDSSRRGSWTPESLFDRDRDLSSRFKDKSEDRHYRSGR